MQELPPKMGVREGTPRECRREICITDGTETVALQKVSRRGSYTAQAEEQKRHPKHGLTRTLAEDY